MMTDRVDKIFESLFGAENVCVDSKELKNYSRDILGEGGSVPLCAVIPKSIDQLSLAVSLSNQLDLPVIATGCGLSTSAGFLSQKDHFMIIDMSSLDHIEEINKSDRYVTVQAGCTWKKLNEYLTKYNLFIPCNGSFSYDFGSVGGSASDNDVLPGFSRYGILGDSVIGQDIILADGSLLETGASAGDGRNPFSKYFGPDMGGIFLGDGGSFGIKARLTLKLLPIEPFKNSISFFFERIEDLVSAQVSLARENIDIEYWGTDLIQNYDSNTLNKSIDKPNDKPRGVIESQSNQKLVDGYRESTHYGYLLDVFASGNNESDVKQNIQIVRRICSKLGAKEINKNIDSISKSHLVISNKLNYNPSEEKSFPVNAMFQLSKAEEVSAVTDEYFIRHQDDMINNEISFSYLTSASRDAFFIECRLSVSRFSDDLHIKGVQEFLKTRNLLNKLCRDLSGLWDTFGATHYQMGRKYGFFNQLSSSARKTILLIKSALDPKGIMNPGVLDINLGQKNIQTTSKFPEFPQNILEDKNVI